MAFATDIDTHSLRLARYVQKPQYLRFLLEQVKSTSQVTHVVGEITHSQQVAFTRNHDLILRLRKRL
ncbi:hypothetical protein D3C72_2012700 [compost metagenome]